VEAEVCFAICRREDGDGGGGVLAARRAERPGQGIIWRKFTTLSPSPSAPSSTTSGFAGPWESRLLALETFSRFSRGMRGAGDAGDAGGGRASLGNFGPTANLSNVVWLPAKRPDNEVDFSTEIWRDGDSRAP